jgi:hypothetical protein
MSFLKNNVKKKTLSYLPGSPQEPFLKKEKKETKGSVSVVS